ncbi:transmembrane protein 135 isoform X2 [Anabrus simplex]|uniref:transmembrane protein 135 isoform X2 n=1 Tax=Anabrus simplex TaxID=316456 RepID=UPI0035A33217
MAVLSKALANRHCQQLIHPWTSSCTLAAVDMCLQCYCGALSFFWILYLIPLIFKYRDIDQAMLLSTLKYLLRSAFFVSIFGSSIYYFHCLFRRILGRYTNVTPVMIPSMIGGLALFIEDPDKWTIDLFAFFNAMLEWLFNLAQREARVKLSSGQRTGVFMVFSSTLMYMLRTRKFREHVAKSGLWFYFPPRVRDPQDEGGKHKVPPCLHEGTCISSIAKEAGKLMGLGLAVQSLRLCAKYITAGPIVLLRQLFSRDNFLLGAFLGSYVAIFKGVTCLLCRLRGHDSELHAVPAGVLAGAAFRLHPDNTIGFSALTTIIQMLVSRLLASVGLGDIPQLKPIAFSLCTGILVNAYLIDPTSTPRIFKSTLDKTTNGRTAFLQNVVLQQFKRYHLERFPIALAGI